MSNKSEATWHPNSGPELPHADLIADLRGLADLLTGFGNRATLRRAADALAALGDTVPREQADRGAREAMAREARLLDERDKAQAERDSLAHVIKQAKGRYKGPYAWPGPLAAQKMHEVLDAAPAVSLALHDAEVWDEGVRAKSASSSIFDADVLAQNPYRAAAIREDAK